MKIEDKLSGKGGRLERVEQKVIVGRVDMI
jgi:hypothetical protein